MARRKFFFSGSVVALPQKRMRNRSYRVSSSGLVHVIQLQFTDFQTLYSALPLRSLVLTFTLSILLPR